MTHKKLVAELLAAAHINPNSFEAELGLLCHKWITIKGLDYVIEALDHQLHAAIVQQDLSIQQIRKN